MKRYFFVMCCFLGMIPAWATGNVYAHQKGEINLGLAVKTAIPSLGTDWGEFNVENKTNWFAHDAKPGDPSIGGDLQAVYFAAPWLALGASVGMDYFHRDLASGVYVDVETTVRNYLALARAYVNPSASYRFYVPVALGMAEISSKLFLHPDEKFKYSGFAGHIGLGVDKSVNERWSLALEARYNYNAFHRTKQTANGDVYRLYPRLSYISYSLRADYRF